MPIKYAIRTRTGEPVDGDALYRHENYDFNLPESAYNYEDVPAIVADMDTENGMYAFFSENETKISQWLKIHNPETVQTLLRNGRAKPGSALKDSIGQDINQGDYLLTHIPEQTSLQLGQVVRNLKTKTSVENLSCPSFSSTETAITNRNPKSHIKIPVEVIEGGTLPTITLETRYSIYDVEDSAADIGDSEFYTVVDAATALYNRMGCFGLFSGEELITGWVPCLFNDRENQTFASTHHGKQKIVEVPSLCPTDALGTVLRYGDWVFSNNNHVNEFVPCRVIGFSKDKVRLMGYKFCHSSRKFAYGQRFFSLNWPKNIVKLPIAGIDNTFI